MTIDQKITFILSVWGATVSTVLALLNFRKLRKEVQANLKLEYKFEIDASAFNVIISNTSYRPLTILSLDLIYAANENLFQLIKTYSEESPIKLQESEIFKQKITTNEIREAVREQKIIQKFYHKLYIRVWTTNVGVYHTCVLIPTIISPKQQGKIGQEYILTDLFLGLPEKEPYVHRRAFTILK